MNRNDMRSFSENPVSLDISRSVFNLDQGIKFSFNVGDVIPFFWEKVLPGDTFTVDTAKVIRMQPLVTPIMDNVYVDTYYFFVPNRLVWDHWINFMGENTDSAWIPQVEYTVPKITIPSGGYNVGTIADYFGIPPKAAAGTDINSLLFRSYALICDQWFRDQNLMNPVHITKDETTLTGSNGSDQVTDIEKGGKPFIAAKYHDYFTSCLPGTQKGQSVQFTLASKAPVFAYADNNIFEAGDDYPDDYISIMFKHWNTSTRKVEDVTATKDLYMTSAGRLNTNNTTGSISSGSPIFPNNLWANLNDVLFSVNELRQAFAVQKYYERLARGGSRYTEMIRSFFNVVSPDARLQRSEYLGGNRVTLNVSQVEQTSATESSIPTPQGNVVGMSVTGDGNSDFTKSFTEHGYIIGVCVARYDHTYQQGIDRDFKRTTVFDFYNPVFANIGEQPVFTTELFADADPDDVFGYQEAWADYRYKPSRVAGEMRTVYTTPLDSWHLADYYASQPYLSAAWIREDKSMLDRCLAVTSAVSNQLIADFFVNCSVARPMPLYSIPGLIDHH